MLGRRRRGRRGTRPREMAIDSPHCVLSQLRRVPAEVLERRREFLLDLLGGLALFDARLHLLCEPLEELAELAEFLLAGGRAVAGHVDVNVPSLDFAESLDPAADVFRLLARPEVREVAVLKQAAEKGDLGRWKADRGLCGRESGLQADQLDFRLARFIAVVAVLLVTDAAECHIPVDG